MHIAVVDTNPAGLALLERARRLGHRVTFVESPTPLYVGTTAQQAIIAGVDRHVPGVITTNAEAVTATLRDVHMADPIDAVVTTHEIVTEAVAEASEVLSLRATSAEGVAIARHKHRTRARLDERGLGNVSGFTVVETVAEAVVAADAIGYPCVLKPPSGGDSILAFTVGDAVEATAAARSILEDVDAVPEGWNRQFNRGILVEEYLIGTMVSVELGVRDGKAYPFSITGRHRWEGNEVVELGSFIPAALSDEARASAVQYAINACEAIGLDLGLFHLEIMMTERGPVLVEANPRVMGGALPTIYEHATGLNIYDGLLQILDPEANVTIPTGFPRTVSGRKIMPLEGGRILPGATLDSVASKHGVLEVDGFESYGVGPGGEVRQGAVIARFMVSGQDYSDAVANAERVLVGIEEEIGLTIRYGEK
ncbi:ATP-grasp domain-containing protein [Pseudarthrobacter oxydans]|uniref:ATP-grasp domain-containing protein n=1 Tax=Pseudarthrobacter oxydans TaxID=1671 RepID=UPI0034291735